MVPWSWARKFGGKGYRRTRKTVVLGPKTGQRGGAERAPSLYSKLDDGKVTYWYEVIDKVVDAGYGNTIANAITNEEINPTGIELSDGQISSWSEVSDYISRTITHNAPIEGSITEFEIGKPVFMTGNVFAKQNSTWSTTTTPTDCICSVKSSGTFREYVGLCAKINSDNTINFATHGDCYFKVDDTEQYQIGDTVLYDKSILGDNMGISVMSQNFCEAHEFCAIAVLLKVVGNELVNWLTG
jgi:hypothetical protein